MSFPVILLFSKITRKDIIVNIITDVITGMILSAQLRSGEFQAWSQHYDGVITVRGMVTVTSWSTSFLWLSIGKLNLPSKCVYSLHAKYWDHGRDHWRVVAGVITLRGCGHGKRLWSRLQNYSTTARHSDCGHREILAVLLQNSGNMEWQMMFI